jgi:hypothetical protein
MRAHAEIVQNGHGPRFDWPINHDDEIIVVRYRSVIFACMVFRYTEWNKRFFLALTFVLFAHRRNGIYKMMYERVKEIAKGKGAIVIQSGVHITNKTMKIASESVGREAVAYIFEEYLEDTKDGNAEQPATARPEHDAEGTG